MTRLFIGIAIPPSICLQFDGLQAEGLGARWQQPYENLHVTLTFIGDVDAAVAGQVAQILRDVQAEPFQLTLKDLGTFSNQGEPHVLWAGVVKNAGLLKLKEKIDAVLRLHHIPFADREYHPHMTLAFLKKSDPDKLKAFLQQHQNLPENSFAVSEFILYQNAKSKENPVYTKAALYPLKLCRS
jgi:2'-5' RNA ligase